MWHHFSTYAYFALALWSLALFTMHKSSIMHKEDTMHKGFTMRAKLGLGIYLLGTLLLLWFLLNLWQDLARPPIRTLAETRLWYSFFLSLIAWISYLLYRQFWMLWAGVLISALFLGITLLYPDTANKTLMPALQSYWFVPHVIVYLFAYSVLGMACIHAIYGIYLYRRGKSTDSMHDSVNRLVYIGYAFLTLGLVFGALWAKEAWGHYWTWDPKETWAFITWLAYLVYIHYNFKEKIRKSISLFYVVCIAFCLLIICWFGVNYLPTAKNSVHTYSKE